MASRTHPSADRASRRVSVIARHLRPRLSPSGSGSTSVEPSACLQYSPPESYEEAGSFDVGEMRRVMDGHHVEARDWLCRVMGESPLFWSRRRGRAFLLPDYDKTMEQQSEATMRRIEYLLQRGAYRGWLTTDGRDYELRRFALLESIGLYDHSMTVKIGVHFFLW